MALTGPLGSCRHRQVLQLPLAARQTAANLAQGMRSSQLAEQHGHELPTTGEAPRVLRLKGSSRYNCPLPRHSLENRQELATGFRELFRFHMFHD